MNWSWKIFTAFNIPVRLHFSMIIIPVIAFSWIEGDSIASVLVSLVLAILLFGSVLLHEFGHALTGRSFGVVTKDIVLTPIGGMARMQSIPTNPRHEIAIAVAGPLVSFAIAGLSWILLAFTPMLSLFREPIAVGAQVLFQLNLMLGLFNLVPALPMDGGRVFRGMLGLKYGHLKATRIAVKTGKILAVAGGFWGIMQGSLSLVLIAVFIYMAAGQEERVASMRDLHSRGAGVSFGGGRPGGFYVYTDRRGAPGGPSEHWKEETERHGQRGDVKVVEGGKVEVISRSDPKERSGS